MREVFLKMRDVLEKDDLVIERNPEEEHQVLVNLPHVAHVRRDWKPRLPGQQCDRKELTDSGDARAIHLNEVNRLRLDQVLECDAVGDMLSGRDP